MPAIAHHRQLDPAGTAQVEDRIHRRPDGAAGVEDVVDQDHTLAGEVDGDQGAPEPGGGASAQIVAVETDVQLSDGDRDLLELFDRIADPFGEGDAP